MEPIKNGLNGRVNPRMYATEPLKRCTLSECKGACCVFGVWVDEREMDDILFNSSLIAPHMAEDLRDPALWFAAYEDKDKHTPSGKVVHTAVETTPEHYGGTACIFWRSDAKCALQVAGAANGMHPWRFKPFYCILHPLDLDEKGRITLDNAADLLNEMGSCLVASDEPVPLVETFSEELEYLLGAKGFAALKEEYLARRGAK